MSLSANTIKVVKATAPVVGEHARQITDLFYKTMFEKNPEVLAFFNMRNQVGGAQPQALANAVTAYGSNIDNLGVLGGAIKLMATKHCGLQVLPEHYGIVHSNLMAAVGAVLGDAVTPEIGNAWSESVLFLAGVLIGEEEKLYKAAEERSGGWRGWKDFILSDIEQKAEGVKTFTMTPVAPVKGTFDFEAGQYLSVLVDPFKDGQTLTAPRHYTITSKPGEDFFQITTKRHSQGLVSGFMHDSLKVGDVVKLSPPFGAFTVAADESPMVLISAGIGMTPTKSFADANGERVKNIVHVDKSLETVPFKDHFEQNYKAKTNFMFSAGGRPAPKDVVAKAMASAADNTKYYMCGPPGFMMNVAKELRVAGVANDNIVWEAFAPQMSCPV